MSRPRRVKSTLMACAIVLSAGLALRATAGWTAPRAEPTAPETSPAASALLSLLNTAPESKLRTTEGMTSDVLAKLMAHRASGGRLANLVEFEKKTGVKPTDLELLLKPFLEEARAREMEAERKAVPDPPTRAKAGRTPKKTDGSAPESPQPAGIGPIGGVRPGFYSKLPGYEDLDKVDSLKKTEFLETVNREMCSCGCKGETVEIGRASCRERV